MGVRLRVGGVGFAVALCVMGHSAPGSAREAQASDLQAVLNRLAAQEAALTQQQEAVARQQKELALQRQEIESLRKQLQSQLAHTDQSQPDAQQSGSQIATVVPYENTVGVIDSGAGDAQERERGLEISGYGIVNYFNRDWDTDEFAKDTMDTERLVIELEYYFDDNWSMTAEVEYEHGGTGAKLELDSQEEFGEFEQEVENSGEVVVEELYVAYRHTDWLNARVGRFIVPVGRTNKYHKPQDYFTVARSDADASMIPQTWSEDGISVFGEWSYRDWGRISYDAQIVNGLDSTGFSSRNWIAGGHQTRFEQPRAEDLAFATRLSYFYGDDLQLAGAYYGGNTNKNRPKNDLDEDAYIDLFEFDGAWTPGDFIFRGQYMWGRLQNSHLVSEANRNLSNNLGVKRTPVGSEARSWYVEAGYDLFDDLFGESSQSLIVFGRYNDYDSMYKAEGLVFDNPRWDRNSWSAGVNYLPIPNVIFKAEYNQRELDLDSDNREDTYALGVGFTY
jgi:hypothetical protein